MCTESDSLGVPHRNGVFGIDLGLFSKAGSSAEGEDRAVEARCPKMGVAGVDFESTPKSSLLYNTFQESE